MIAPQSNGGTIKNTGNRRSFAENVAPANPAPSTSIPIKPIARSGPFDPVTPRAFKKARHQEQARREKGPGQCELKQLVWFT